MCSSPKRYVLQRHIAMRLLRATPTWLVGVGLLMVASAQAGAAANASGQGAQPPNATQLPAMRIVSLLPSLTEMVCALDACDRLVGIDNHANWPEQVNRLPRLGGLGQVSVEAIVRLQPDVVLVPRSARLAHRLKQLGLEVLELEPQNTAQARQAWLDIAKVLGRTDGEARWTLMQQEVDAIAKQVQPMSHGLTVYFEISDAPYAAGASSFIGELMARLGLKNVVPAQLGAFPKLSHEFVLTSRPDVVIAAKHSKSPVLRNHPWHCTMTTVQNDALVRPGPRMAEAARALQACIQKGRANQKTHAEAMGVTP